MNVVQSFGAEEETREIFGNLTDEHQQSFVDAVRYADMFGPVIDFCWGIGAMMLYLVGVRFLGFEKVSVGLLVAFGTYINMFWNPIMNLSNFYNNLVTNLTAAERILIFWIQRQISWMRQTLRNCRKYREEWNFPMSALHTIRERRRRQRCFPT